MTVIIKKKVDNKKLQSINSFNRLCSLHLIMIDAGNDEEFASKENIAQVFLVLVICFSYVIKKTVFTFPFARVSMTKYTIKTFSWCSNEIFRKQENFPRKIDPKSHLSIFLFFYETFYYGKQSP